MSRLTIEVTGDRGWMDIKHRLDDIPITVERVHVKGIDADEYTVRKVVGYLENLGFKVTWKETQSDEAVVRKSLIGEVT